MTKCSAHTHIMNCYLYSYAFLRPDCAGGTLPSSHSSVFMPYYAQNQYYMIMKSAKGLLTESLCAVFI